MVTADGGIPLDGRGYFTTPTVLANVPNARRDPPPGDLRSVAPVTTSNNEEDAIRLANASDYGLAA